ncbi:dihydroneopterin aldolase [Natronocella acetinitrilica]|jgi:7,8-dihydroneopterin aldolase/epimerase/oxygenase|uniref:7,8-dihydroneopterin aldolase n=1 Tax=Natronocella acetinitrilica TaxID=414046 RepID=A0AAE3G0L7_9GAMM|nr:dihydroneopterin aldolase [Natronocella acetinitrilica]MCP1673194.1 dihydroneopterin aldolase [Natronocella acetinitrilica]
MDTVFIRALGVESIIGVHAWERRLKQRLTIDLDLAWNTAAAAADDDLSEALDYAAVAARVQSLAAAESCHLLETLAERMADTLREEFGVAWLRLRVSKPGAVAGAAAVGVVIERGQPG